MSSPKPLGTPNGEAEREEEEEEKQKKKADKATGGGTLRLLLSS